MKNKAIHWELICFITYIAAYLCRVNYSSALTFLSAARSYDYNQLATAGAAFFAVYAVGQLFNGFLGDQMHPVRLILVAIIGTSICNIGIAFSSEYVLVLVLWAINGYFQSFFWCTMIRLLSMVSNQSVSGTTSAFISSAMPVGYFISWCVLSPCFSEQNVQLFFLVPALFMLPVLALWAGKTNSLFVDNTHKPTSCTLRIGITKTLRVLSKEKLFILLAVLICHGLIKEGIAFWIPTIIHTTLHNTGLATAALSLLPAANLAGTLIARELLKRWNNVPLRIIQFGFALMLPLCVICILPINVLVLIPLCLISCLSYCINTVLLSFVPMQYQTQGVVSSMIGIFDFCSYMGAALSTYALGSIIGTKGIESMAIVWIVSACASLIILGFKHFQNQAND